MVPWLWCLLVAMWVWWPSSRGTRGASGSILVVWVWCLHYVGMAQYGAYSYSHRLGDTTGSDA